MAIYKCKKCGSTIEYEQGATFVVCGSCGTKQMLPHPDDDRQTSLYGYANVEPLLKRAFMFLEDEEWEKADAYCEKVLDNDPENAQAYLGKLMAEQHVQRQDELTNCRSPFDESKNYQKIIRFGDEKLKTELRGYIDSKVFLLSITEVTDYLNGNELRKCAPTNYANAQREKKSDSCIWWLRSPGKYLFRASNVAYSGYVDEYGNEVDDSDVMVRPAMWINFGS